MAGKNVAIPRSSRYTYVQTPGLFMYVQTPGIQILIFNMYRLQVYYVQMDLFTVRKNPITAFGLYKRPETV